MLLTDNKVMLEILEVEKTTISGIYNPTDNNPNVKKGKVIATGPGLTSSDGTRIPLLMKTGDVVLFGLMGGMRCSIRSNSKINEYVVIAAHDVIGVYEDGEE